MAARTGRRSISGRLIPGIGGAANTDLAVLKPMRRLPAGPTATQWLAGLPWWTALVLMAPLLLKLAKKHFECLKILWMRWLPFLPMKSVRLLRIFLMIPDLSVSLRVH